MMAVSLDIDKAFKMTWRHVILMKLYAYGFRGNLSIFIYNFPQEKTFSAMAPGNVILDFFVHENGMLQSSVLSPI